MLACLLCRPAQPYLLHVVCHAAGPLLAIRLSSFSVVTSTSGGSDTCTSAPQTPPVHPNKLTEAVVLIDLATTETTTALVHKTEGARDGDKKEMLPRWLRYLTACFVGA